MPSLRLTVVTPSLNQGRFIEDAIRSVEAQGPVVLEHLVFDAVSSDETRKILERCSTSGPLRWRSERDDGQSDAINKGFLAARGDVVAWLNADDYYLPGALTVVAQAFQENPDLDIIYGESQFVDERGNPLRTKRDHRFDANILIYYGCYIMSTATFFRRRVIDDGHLLDTSYRVTMDYEYFVRLAAAGYRYGFVPSALAAFRWHDTNVSSRLGNLRREERLRVQRQYGGLSWIPSDGARVRCFDALAQLHKGKRHWLKTIERLSGRRNRPLLRGH